jgi:F-type H+-transporting ATPase subunit a
MSLNPFTQFKVRSLVDLSLFDYDISFTNSSLFMCIAVFLIGTFCYFSSRSVALIPGKLQSSMEILFEFVDDTLVSSAGKSSRVFFPFIFTIFSFITTLNVLGLVPYGFSVTGQLIVTFAMAALVFITVVISGFIRHGIKFFSLFLPHGTPMCIAPLMIVIELFSFLVRPVTLSLRLAGNMIAGHVLLKVLGGFVIMMGIGGLFPLAFMVVMVGFEFFIAILQAYIFTILTCVYLNDAVNLH